MPNSSIVCVHFYSHIPCGMWLKSCKRSLPVWNFYSHIPCGMWLFFFFCQYPFRQFLLTHPVWDVTRRLMYSLLRGFLLTHPVWDVTLSIVSFDAFNAFLLTHPVWDVTIEYGGFIITLSISTHTSRVGCDADYGGNHKGFKDFYSHIPCGMWPFP